MRRLLTALALVTLAATPGWAQDAWNVQFTKGAFQYAFGGLGVGAYGGRLSATPTYSGPTPAASPFGFWCVDANGRFATGAATVRRVSSLSGPTRDRLAQAAYLTTLASSHASNAGMANLHAAIWTVTSGMPTGWAPQSQSAVASLVAQAQTNASRVNLDQFFYIEFSNASAQELLFHGGGDPFQVPEPASVTLLATGLVGLAAARRGRRRR